MIGDLDHRGRANKTMTWQKQVKADFKRLKADFDDCYDRDRWRRLITGQLEIVLLDGSVRSAAAAQGRRRTGRRDYGGPAQQAPLNYMGNRALMAQAIVGKRWEFISRDRFLVEGGEHRVERVVHLDHLGVDAKEVYGQQFYQQGEVYVIAPPKPNFQDLRRAKAQGIAQKKWDFDSYDTFRVEGDETVHKATRGDFDENMGVELYKVYGESFYLHDGLFKML